MRLGNALMLGVAALILVANLSTPGYLKFATPFLDQPLKILRRVPASWSNASKVLDAEIAKIEKSKKDYKGIDTYGAIDKCLDDVPSNYEGFDATDYKKFSTADTIGKWDADKVTGTLGAALCLSAENKAIYAQRDKKAYLEITYNPKDLKLRGYLYKIVEKPRMGNSRTKA